MSSCENNVLIKEYVVSAKNNCLRHVFGQKCLLCFKINKTTCTQQCFKTICTQEYTVYKE